MKDWRRTARVYGNVAIWLLRLMITGVFIVSALPKLLGQEAMIDIFAAIGLGQWLRVVTGPVEGLGSVLILIPAASGLGAIVVLLVDAGAFIAQVGVLHGDIVHTLVIALLISPWRIFRAAVRMRRRCRCVMLAAGRVLTAGCLWG